MRCQRRRKIDIDIVIDIVFVLDKLTNGIDKFHVYTCLHFNYVIARKLVAWALSTEHDQINK